MIHDLRFIKQNDNKVKFEKKKTIYLYINSHNSDPLWIKKT